MEVGVPELLIIAFIVLLVFGPGKVADIGGSLGRAFREFRRVSDDGSTPVAHADSSASSQTFCTGCGAEIAKNAKFCGSCGTPVTAGP